ncbi:MAG TPA: carboxypeptidase-like regulatory domain-containing protein, partial [Candidatus Dormibacteraeota bacterium]|nr:carboxypeptidase-like regulatory domain-containing protein [Candidatus Dormibacteraeota bacterium]
MRYAFLAPLLVLVAACGAYAFPGTTTSPVVGTVSGRVIAIPCSPIEPAQQDACNGRPVPGLEISFADGQAVHSTTTNSNGLYSIGLVPGDYKVTMKTYMRVISGPPSIKVDGGSTVVADYV